MYRLRFAASMLLAGLLTSGFLAGQEKKQEKNDDKEPVIIKATLPRHYRSLGLSDKQKKNVYTVKARYTAKIEELQRQIDALKAEENTELEKLLTDAQKARLAELRAGKDKDTKDKPAEPAEKPSVKPEEVKKK
jgi:hypothetical protein